MLAEATKGRWFTVDFRVSHPEQADRFIAMSTGVDPEGTPVAARRSPGSTPGPGSAGSTYPVRVVGGAQDPVAPPDAGEAMASAIPGADLVMIDDASHIACVAQPEAFNAAVTEHLRRHL